MRYPAILAAAAAVLGAATVFAAPAAAETDVAVDYSDLDLSTKAGQDRLDRRIDSAARAVCNMDEIRTGSFTTSTAQRRCYKETKASVHARVAQLIANDSRGG